MEGKLIHPFIPSFEREGRKWAHHILSFKKEALS